MSFPDDTVKMTTWQKDVLYILVGTPDTHSPNTVGPYVVQPYVVQEPLEAGQNPHYFLSVIWTVPQEQIQIFLYLQDNKEECIKYLCSKPTWKHMPITQAFGRLRQQDSKLKAHVGSIVMPVCEPTTHLFKTQLKVLFINLKAFPLLKI